MWGEVKYFEEKAGNMEKEAKNKVVPGNVRTWGVT